MRKYCCVTGMILLCLSIPAAPAVGQAVVSNNYANLDANRALKDVPVTLSRIGVDGDFKTGICPSIAGQKLPAQVDVLRRAADGSIRHALVSFVLPELPAGGKVTVDWLNAKPADPPAFKWAVDKGLDLKLVLAKHDGGAITSDLGKILGGKLAASDRVKILHDGPVMKEYEIYDMPVDAAGNADKQIDVLWRLRVFTGRKSVRVACVVESCKDRVTGMTYPKKWPAFRKFKGVKLISGDKVLYEEGAYSQLDQTRYRILVWTAGQIEDIHRRPNYSPRAGTPR